MKSTLFLFLALVPLFSNAFVEWPFKINDFQILIFNASFGTPSQTLPIGTFHLGFPHPTVVPDKASDQGTFDSTKSSTFVKVGDAKDANGTVNGILGTDTIKIGDSLVVKTSAPFIDIKTGWLFPGLGVFTLSRSPDKGSLEFAEKLVENQKEKVIVLTYDKWSDPSKASGLTGTFNIGGRPTQKCAAKWTRFSEANYTDRPREQWTVNLNKIQAGTFSQTTPAQISFQLNDPSIGMPNSTYDSVLKALGSTNKKTIPCTAKADIKFTLDKKFEITITARDYLIKNDDGTCNLRANRLKNAKKGFILPMTVLRDYCLLVDYDKKEVGLSQRTF